MSGSSLPDADKPRKRRAMQLLLLTLSLAFSLALAEGFCRCRGVAPLYTVQQPFTSGIVVRLNPRNLFEVIPAGRPDINRTGFRDYDFPVPRSKKKRVIFLGDSFVMGLNVAPADTMPKQLETLLGVDQWEVFNMGTLCYGPDQSYIRLLDEGVSFQPDAVVLSIYAGNDFADVYKNQLFLVDAQGACVFNPQNPVAQVLPFSRLGLLLHRITTGHFLDPSIEEGLLSLLMDDKPEVLHVDNPERRQKIALMRGILQNFRQTLAAAGIPLTVIILPRLDNIQDDTVLRREGISEADYFTNEVLAEKACTDLDLRFLSLRDLFLENRSKILF